MPAVKVEFSLEKSAGSRERVTLDRPGMQDSPIVFIDGKATKFIEADTALVAPWVLVGAVGDKISVTWKTATLEGVLLAGAISAASPDYPGGGKYAVGMGYLPPLPVAARTATSVRAATRKKAVKTVPAERA